MDNLSQYYFDTWGRSDDFVKVPVYLNHLDRVFHENSTKCKSTSDFLGEVVNTIPTDYDTLDRDIYCDVFIFHRTGFKFKNLNKVARFYKSLDLKEMVDFLFDKCGTSGWEVVHTDVGRFKMRNSGQLEFAYGLYVLER